ncbi:MAG: hypothetical protein ACF788_07900 [Novipirellula sp. JB048]
MPISNPSSELPLPTADPEPMLDSRSAVPRAATTCSWRTRRSAVILCLLTSLVGFLVGGCGDDPVAQELQLRRACLVELGAQYRRFAAQQAAAPASVGAFAGFIAESRSPQIDAADQRQDDSSPDVVNEALIRLADGDILMIYNAVSTSDPNYDGEAILGYEAVVPQSGGYVVTADGEVKHLSAAGFADIPKTAALDPAASP